MQKPHVILSIALAALAALALSACSHPSAAVARRKAVKNWLSTPSWTPRQCAAPCGAPPPPPQAAPHRQH